MIVIKRSIISIYQTRISICQYLHNSSSSSNRLNRSRNIVNRIWIWMLIICLLILVMFNRLINLIDLIFHIARVLSIIKVLLHFSNRVNHSMKRRVLLHSSNKILHSMRSVNFHSNSINHSNNSFNNPLRIWMWMWISNIRHSILNRIVIIIHCPLFNLFQIDSMLDWTSI